MNEQSVKSSPDKFRCDKPRIHGIGSNGSFATTRPSKLKKSKTFFSIFSKHLDRSMKTNIELNMPNKAMKVKLDANIDFIFT